MNPPISYLKLQHLYFKRIPTNVRTRLDDKIYDAYPQAMIAKALTGSITHEEADELLTRGNLSAKEYPGLYYLCEIYIHPLTPAEYLLNKAAQIERMIE